MATFKAGSRINHSIKVGFDLDMLTRLLQYSECGKIAEAKQFFDSIFLKDLVSWNTMITAYSRSHHGMGMHAAETFQLMLRNGFSLDYRTYIAVLSGCFLSGLLEQGIYYFRSMMEFHKKITGLKALLLHGLSPRS
jgi:pentatricopeptide repeat protein